MEKQKRNKSFKLFNLNFCNKNGGSVIALVIVLMLIFPFIISGLIDLTNCSMLKRTLKQELNSAVKAAANSIDVKATRNGVYKIADGVLCTDVYGTMASTSSTFYSTNCYYKKKYFDAGKVFFEVLEKNKLIGTGTNAKVWDNVSIQKSTFKNAYPACEYDSSSPWCTYEMSGNKNSASLKRNTKVFFTIVNNGYYYNSKIDDYLDANPTQTTEPISIEIGQNTGLIEGTTNSWANWNPMGANASTNTTIYIDSFRPTVIGMVVVEYEPSKLFHLFGNNFKKIYIKEYATAELIVSDTYWISE